MYLLDTNIIIFAKNKRNEEVRRKIASVLIGEMAVSQFTVAELIYGCEKSSNPKQNRQAILEFLFPFQMVNFDQRDCDTYGKIRAQLERAGKPIGTIDTFIAALAMSRDFVLVTNNVCEFERIEGLRFEDWSMV